MKVKLGALAGFTAMLFLSACVAPFPPELEAENHDRVAKVLANAYEEVTENYIDPIDVGDLAVGGLSNLARFDPAFSVEADGPTVSLKLRSDEVYSFSKPLPDDIEAWAMRWRIASLPPVHIPEGCKRFRARQSWRII